MPFYKVLVDSRRKINSGVGRVSQWIADHVIEFCNNSAHVIHLVNADSLTADYNILSQNILETDIKPFSENEFYELPNLIARYNFDLYINPQMSWSYLHTTPTINMVHDLWAIKNPEWLPSEGDLKSRFRVNDISYFKQMSSFLNEETARQYLTPYGFSQWEIANKSNNIIWLGSWAQYAAITSRSKRYVAVSPYIKHELEKYFVDTNNIIVINNVPKEFDVDKNASKSHFLTLSKLEERKNLDYLLDSYELYATIDANAIPLVIAGDQGYGSVASRLINRIANMQNKGMRISFKPSVADKELTELLQQAAALVFTSHFEGFGLPPLEAMLAEVPVIATPTGMMATDLGKYVILINGKDVNELANHMRIVATEGVPTNVLTTAKNAVKTLIKESMAVDKWKGIVIECLVSKDEAVFMRDGR